MKKKKIFPKDILTLHPYDKTDRIDQYYAQIANRVANVLYDSHLTEILEDNDEVCHVAIVLTAWFEDIITQTGIWQSFTAECKKRYGAYLPFYELNEDTYYPDEINLADVQFLLWNYLQQLVLTEQFLNPENPKIMSTSHSIYTIFEEEYEYAPENERLRTYLCSPEEIAPDDFYAYREIMEWFYVNSYFHPFGISTILEKYDEVMEEYEKNGDVNEEHMNKVLYQTRLNLIFEGRTEPLSLTTTEWFARFWSKSANSELFANVKTRRFSSFLYLKEDDKYIYVRDLEGDGATLNINKESLNISRNATIIKEKTILNCSLVYFGDSWWQYGILSTNNYDNKIKEDIELKNLIKVGGREFNKIFTKVTNGNSAVFCKTKEEIKHFLFHEMKLNDSYRIEDWDISEGRGAALFSIPNSTFYIQTELYECIKSDDNPMYDEKIASEDAWRFIIDPDVIPYEYCCFLSDNGMLADAQMNSLKGEAYGKAFFQKNIQFFMDYFHQSYREKDC